ncbi:phosphoglycerate dehydrogenase [Alkalihalobacillus sp. CinArs1]|uniref:phosphoglycerate dehydrogenase n=1 Tax=Alkalihalobacillus sp. CinArs1 TaxID=2995314 RepID=UPI0022DDC53A|nr:phosphoglycerate dehydrogenase [Alkalihalobacillus sp. CinArs1]
MLITPRSYGLYHPKIYEYWKKEGYEVVRKAGPHSEEDLITYLEGVEVLLVGTDHISKKVIQNAKELKVISKYGVGIDNIDCEAARKCGIEVLNTPGVNTEAVADYAFGLMLSLSRHIARSHFELVQEGTWNKTVGVEIFGKTLGLMGLGSIGAAVAKRAKGFNMNVIAYDPFPNEQLAQELGVTLVSLEDVIRESDIVSMHLPLTKETRYMIDCNRLKKMKKNCLLINTARGGVINELHLYEALRDGEIKGAALDVFEEEPPTNSPLFELDNVILTPHNAAASVEAVQRMTLRSTDNVMAYYESLRKAMAPS